jgi:adenosine deaminase
MTPSACPDDSHDPLHNLPQEYALAAAAFGLDEAALIGLAEAAARFAFVGGSERHALLRRVAGFRAAWEASQAGARGALAV